MADVTIVPADIKPLNSALISNWNAGEAIDLGESVFIAAADGDLELGDATAAASAQLVGVCVSCPRGALVSVAGERIDVVTYGAVGGFSGLTPGQLLYASINAGKIADAVPAATNYKWILGRALTATEVFVNPFTDDTAVLT
jgi:hypothetical protein